MTRLLVVPQPQVRHKRPAAIANRMHAMGISPEVRGYREGAESTRFAGIGQYEQRQASGAVEEPCWQPGFALPSTHFECRTNARSHRRTDVAPLAWVGPVRTSS